MTVVWLNGALLEAPAARIDPADRGFTLGDGVFETLRVKAGRPCQLERHLARLRQGLGLLDLPLGWSDEALGAAMEALLQACGLAEGVLRLTVTRGPAPRGVLPPARPAPTVLLTAAPGPPPRPPARAVIAQGTRRNEHSPLSRIKSLNYLDGILAQQEAARRGADEAILRNTAGRLAETATSNLFLVQAGRLVTPPVSEGALPGVMRAVVLAQHGGEERPLAVADLEAADEAFLTSSLGLRPVIAIDGRPVGSGAPGPVTRALMAALG